ncbi:FAD:protein FMN transferase [Helcococcus kunzii]|uniref:FAD:protein FMN transferase n=1 Tax=Helcococcus kunzii ATCC 51366 TaxID=883114 RepID=H3NNY4_9FIRM|nr:FAD:protein FMN transferase [Helcococcus kunzii]EHR34109.1 hypothetical protein HMPREF9709_01045 [Helcococcus kunzii ATCC 51366]MCT1795718.1 FAD:protein FMN transferase [Helcococcus kunzii]MCT1988679.1 FAD:protein FMN transferase [Helcococcus kunzii]QUY64957.1 FAD:protein FMN transferase [Helcococcus kunzii]QZO75664.1 FAD:protein FMN transferase [Helcococcus kunzii]
MKYNDLNIELMGTKIHIRLLHENPTKILNECKDLLYKYNDVFSIYHKTSELYKLNLQASKEPFQTSTELFELIKLGKKYSLLENSTLNICIGPLVKLWNIGFDSASVPSKEKIQNTLSLVNPKDLILNEKNSTVFFNKNGMVIDLGAIAKGYIADKIMEFIISNGVKSALVDLGGNILTHGFNFNSEDLNWRIGLQDPKSPRGTHLMLLEINDLSIVTSGVYERKLNYNGKLYHHIFDSKTGYPVDTDMQSISIISRKSVDCDIFTSVLFGKNFNEINDFISKNNEIEAIAIYNSDIIKYTKGIEKYILWKDRK